MVASPLPTWNVSAGVSTLHVFNSQFDSHGTSTIYGWRGTASEYPYAAHLWIGGAAQVSGYYDTVAATGTPSLGSSTASGSVHLYTFLLGPSVRLPSRRIQLFANALAGVVAESSSSLSTTVGTIPVTGAGSSSASHFGTGIEGGVDLPVSSRWAVRAHSDWLRVYPSGNSIDFLESSGGLAYRF